ncbi:hypothetical protein [Pseudarthrobacter enclensis]
MTAFARRLRALRHDVIVLPSDRMRASGSSWPK